MHTMMENGWKQQLEASQNLTVKPELKIVNAGTKKSERRNNLFVNKTMIG